MSDTLTAEQIEDWRTTFARMYVGESVSDEINALCDLAIKGLQRPDLEAAARVAIGFLENSIRMHEVSLAEAVESKDYERANKLQHYIHCLGVHTISVGQKIRQLATGQDAQVQAAPNAELLALADEAAKQRGVLQTDAQIKQIAEQTCAPAAEPERRKGERRDLSLTELGQARAALDIGSDPYAIFHKRQADRRKPGGKP